MYLCRSKLFSLNLRCTARLFTTSPQAFNSVRSAAFTAVKEETRDVTAIDSLLNVIKQRVDPRFGSVMPIRIPSLWAEASLAVTEDETNRSTSSIEPSSGTLPPRNMHDSYTEFVLPFATDSGLLEEYVNAYGGIRMGKLMEHLDSLAGSISYKHVFGPTSRTIKIEEMGLYIVTAGVERLDMLRPLDPIHDLRLSGQVIYTGRSSMEVVVRIERLAQNANEKDATILLGRFSMVCRSTKTNQAHPVNSLIISTEEEKALFAIGEELKRKRASLAQRSLSRVPPSSEEAAVLHAHYLKFGGAINEPGIHHETSAEIRFVDAGSDSEGLNYTLEPVPMGKTRIERCMLMFPQERNVHQKIFGGYLMRLAYELGFSNASMFCRGHVQFLALDEISFKLPVPIGSILKLTSVVLYDGTVKERENGEDNVYQLVHVGVKADVVDIKTGIEETTNEFSFTWRGEEKLNQDLEAAKPHAIKKVVPRTYQGAMLWLNARRKVAIGDEIRSKRREVGDEIRH